MDHPDDPPQTPDDTADPFADAPDPWAESDRAWDARWSDAPVDDVVPVTPASGEASPRATPASVADSYLDGMQGAGPYLGLGMQIAASMALFVGGGYAVDRWMGTSPVGLLVGAALGMAGIVALVVRIAREADAERDARKGSGEAKK